MKIKAFFKKREADLSSQLNCSNYLTNLYPLTLTEVQVLTM